MKKVFGILLAVVLVLSGLTARAAQKDTLRILAIGNSFSWNAVEQNLSAIALADGKCAIIGNMYIGGCSLERHWNNAKTDNTDYSYRKINRYDVKTTKANVTLAEALADEPWDIVTFQQASHFSGFPDTYEPYLTELIAYVRARVPAGTKLYWHQTWAYAKTSTHKSFPNYDKDQDKMYGMIMSASALACKKHKLPVIPCGTTMQNLRGTFVGDNVTVDGFHLNYLGRYAAACTWYRILFGESVEGNAFRPQYLTEEEVVAAQKAAEAAARKPFKVTAIR